MTAVQGMSYRIESLIDRFEIRFIYLCVEHLVVNGGINGRGTLIPFQQIQTFELDTVDVPLRVNLIDLRSHPTYLPS